MPRFIYLSSDFKLNTMQVDRWRSGEGIFMGMAHVLKSNMSSLQPELVHAKSAMRMSNKALAD